MDLGYAKGALIGLVVLAVTGAIGVAVVVGVQGSFTANTAAYNVTVSIINAFTNFFNLAPTLGTVLIAVVLLGAVAFLGYVGYQRMGNQ